MLHHQFDIQLLLFIAAGGFLAPSESTSKLSKRENEVLAHLARGKTAKAIGMQLNLSKRTIEHHIANIKNKTNCNSRAELINLYWGGL